MPILFGQDLEVTREFQIDLETKVSLIHLDVSFPQGVIPPRHQWAHLRLQENGLDVPITAMELADLPFYLLILIDLSASNEPQLDAVFIEIRRLLSRLPERHFLAIAGFGEMMVGHLSFSKNREELAKRLDRLHPLGSTALFQALEQGWKALSQVPAPSGILVFSDGIDLMSANTLGGLSARLGDNGAPLWFCYTGPRELKGDLLIGQLEALARLVDQSGGQWWADWRQGTVKVADLMEEQSKRLRLWYEPPVSSETEVWRSLRLLWLDGSNHFMVYRRGYTLQDVSKKGAD
jgi:hypothetical protein